MGWQSSSLGPKRRGVMETSTLACGWPASQASSQGPGQSLNQHIGHKEGLQARPASRHGPHLHLCLLLPVSLSLSLSLSLFAGTLRMKNGHGPDSHRRECRHAHNGEVRRPSQASSNKSSPRPVSKPYGQPTKSSMLSLSLSLSLPLSFCAPEAYRR